ncbi:MAG: metal ABC transporter ATP-binding protein [Hydrogenothermaceae bacterium]|nr:metal ABC transporter ATP-binding protein [Hydrogenothermaceae bacterium]
MIEIKDLTVIIDGKIIIEDINLNIEDGEIVAIVGPNGGGKTTLIKTLLGFITPSSGVVYIDGKNPKGFIKESKVGYLPQKSSYEKDFPVSALDVVMFGLINEKIPKSQKIRKAMEYMKYVGMEGFENYPFGRLSGGQQQRVMIARALISQPKLLILDEPSTGIDVVAQENFYEFLKKINQDRGITVIMVSHDVGVVANYVHKVAGLNRKLHFFGKPKDFFQTNVLNQLYGSDVNLLIHSPECITCQHFMPDKLLEGIKH